jgi:hypothetical protein
MDWFLIIANLINYVLVIAGVQWLKSAGMDWLKDNAPWSLPILALVGAQALNFLASTISTALGYPVSFDPIIAVITGSMAVVSYDVKHTWSKKR